MKSKVGVQMYTLRQHTQTAKDLEQTLKKIKEIGYPGVQASCIGAMDGENPEVSAKDLKRLLDDIGLRCISTHRAWTDLLTKTEEEIEIHKILDCDYVAIGGIKTDYPQTVEGFNQFLTEARPLIAKLKEAGIRFGYHNHSHEFHRPLRHGKTLQDILIEEGGAGLMLELDLYWVDHAGINCERIIERCHGRIPTVHLKDKEVDPTEGPRMAPIGEGNLDWDHILPACEKAGVEWYLVEQDHCYRDAFDCLKSSFEYLRGKGL